MSHKRKEIKKWIAAILAVSMLSVLLAGCKGQGAGEDPGNAGNETTIGSGENKGDAAQEDSSAAEPEANTAMGRYVESEIDLSEYCSDPRGLDQLEDGTLVISDHSLGRVISTDNGLSWEWEDTVWFQELRSKGTVRCMDYGLDGTAAVLYMEHEEAEEGDDTEEKDFFYTSGLVIKPDGTQIPFDIPMTEDDSWMAKVWVTDTGRVFVTTLGENIYEVKEDGSSEKFLTVTGGRPECVSFQGNIMMIDGYGFNGILLYDMEKGEFIEDQVLTEFVNENYRDRDYSTEGCFDIYCFGGEEGVLYLAGEKGLYRHVIGGGAMEQVIDGTLSSFGNPTYLLMEIMMLPDHEFLALFQGKKLVRFTYNPDIPTVPDKTLKVYSLEESDTVSQAVSIYQVNNPEVYIKYEVGMSKGNSVTRDDALKKLNTEIMAGQGPDILILDNMPMDSYIEKGMLLDLNEYLEDMEEENRPYANIVNAFKQEGKVYTIPCEIQLPILQGKEKYVSGVKNLKDIADMMEAVREDVPEKAILDVCSEKGIMRLFAMLSEPVWKTEKGELDREVLKEFLEQTKRIYDAQMDGIEEETVERYRNRNENYMNYYQMNFEDSDYIAMTNILNFIGDYIQIQFGRAYYRGDITEGFSLKRVKGFEDYEMVPMGIDGRKVFYPKSLVGINAATSQKEEAVKMLKVFLGEESQTSLYNGFPVTKAGLEKGIFWIDESWIGEDGAYSSMASSNGDGEKLEFTSYWFDEEQKQFLRDWLESVELPYIPDPVLEEAVCTEGKSYMQGKQSLEEAVDAILQKVSIYMAE